MPSAPPYAGPPPRPKPDCSASAPSSDPPWVWWRLWGGSIDAAPTDAEQPSEQLEQVRAEASKAGLGNIVTWPRKLADRATTGEHRDLAAALGERPAGDRDELLSHDMSHTSDRHQGMTELAFDDKRCLSSKPSRSTAARGRSAHGPSHPSPLHYRLLARARTATRRWRQTDPPSAALGAWLF